MDPLSPRRRPKPKPKKKPRPPPQVVQEQTLDARMARCVGRFMRDWRKQVVAKRDKEAKERMQAELMSALMQERLMAFERDKKRAEEQERLEEEQRREKARVRRMKAHNAMRRELERNMELNMMNEEKKCIGEKIKFLEEEIKQEEVRERAIRAGNSTPEAREAGEEAEEAARKKRNR